MFNAPQPRRQERWQWELDRFVDQYRIPLAALAWSLGREWGDRQRTLGIDLRPQPHFVPCDRPSLDRLNEAVQGQIQEILGIVDGYDPDREVTVLVIGPGQVKLIHYQPPQTPPECAQAWQGSLDALIAHLETALGEMISPLDTPPQV